MQLELRVVVKIPVIVECLAAGQVITTDKPAVIARIDLKGARLLALGIDDAGVGKQRERVGFHLVTERE
jgi:hypothetical protein